MIRYSTNFIIIRLATVYVLVTHLKLYLLVGANFLTLIQLMIESKNLRSFLSLTQNAGHITKHDPLNYQIVPFIKSQFY
jgi:hypothetical protein